MGTGRVVEAELILIDKIEALYGVDTAEGVVFKGDYDECFKYMQDLAEEEGLEFESEGDTLKLVA